MPRASKTVRVVEKSSAESGRIDPDALTFHKCEKKGCGNYSRQVVPASVRKVLVGNVRTLESGWPGVCGSCGMEFRGR